MINKLTNDSTGAVSEDRYTHGVSQSCVPESEIDVQLEELRRSGYTLLDKIFSKDDCEIAKKKLDKIYKRQIEECGGEEYLIAINDQNVVRTLFVYDDFFIINNNKNNKTLRFSLFVMIIFMIFYGS